jgi:AraC family transcriptional regulator
MDHRTPTEARVVATWEQVTEGWRTRTIVQTAMVTIGECRCIPGSPAGVRSYISDGFECVFPRRGLFAKDASGRSILADPNSAVVFTPGEVITTRRMFEYGFDCRWVRISRPFLDGLIDRTESLPAAPVPVPARQYLMQQLFAAEGTGDLARIEEEAVGLIETVLGSARRADGGPALTRPTADCHADQADAAKRVIAACFRERLTVGQIARAVHASPFHLCRVFRGQTGIPLHRYLLSVRLRAAVEEILDGGPDLSSLALRLGFSSHSHFTSAFRREFGLTPSALRERRGLSRAPVQSAG